MATGTIAAITAGVSAVGAVGSAYVSNKQRIDNANNYNRSMDFNAQEAQKAREYESQEWDRRFKIESEYNSPTAQVGRLAEAGLNAQSLYGDSGNAGQVFGVNSPNVPAPAAAPAAPYSQQNVSNMTDVVNSISNLVGAAAGAFRNTKEGESIAATIDGMVKNLELRNTAQALDNANKEIENTIKGQTGLLSAWTDIKLKFTDMQMHAAMGKAYDSEALLNDAQRFLADAEKKLKDKELEKLTAIMPYVIQGAQMNVQVLKSERDRNNDEGYKFRNEGDEANARKNLVNVQKAIAVVEQKIKESPEYKKTFIEKMRADCDKVLADIRLSDAERQRVLELKEQLSKENAWYNFNQIWSKVTDVADIGLDAFRTITFQNFFNQESSRKNERDKFEREHYNDVTEFDETHYYDSQGRRHRTNVSRKRAPFGKR